MRVRCLRALALSAAVVLTLRALGPRSVEAASPPHTPTPAATATAYPTYTALATYTPAPTQTAYPSPTVAPSPSPSPSPIPQGTDPSNTHHYCTGLLNWCPDLSGLFNAVGGVINGAIVALFSPLEHAFSDSFTRLVAPFQKDLTYTPDIPHEASWGGLRNVQTALQELAATLFFGFLLVGVFARYLEQLGHGDFAQLTSPLRRGVVVTGLIAGYPTVMAGGLTVVNSAASVINGIPLDAHETAWEAVRGAMFTLGNAFSFQGVLDVLVMLVAYALVILSVVVRDFGLGTLGALYIVGPLCLACFVSPYLEVIARAWVKMVMSLALWPIGYAIVLKVIALMFAGGGPLSEFGGFSAALGALGLVLLLYKTPAVVGSFVGSTGAVLGAVASSVTDAGLGSAVGAARSFLGSKGFPGAGH